MGKTRNFENGLMSAECVNDFEIETSKELSREELRLSKLILGILKENDVSIGLATKVLDSLSEDLYMKGCKKMLKEKVNDIWTIE